MEAYQRTVEEALQEQHSSMHGLSEAQAQERSSVFGLNKLQEEKKASLLKRLPAKSCEMVRYGLLQVKTLFPGM